MCFGPCAVTEGCVFYCPSICVDTKQTGPWNQCGILEIRSVSCTRVLSNKRNPSEQFRVTRLSILRLRSLKVMEVSRGAP